MTLAPPDNPIGPLESIENYDGSVRLNLIESIQLAPQRLRVTVSGLTDSQLDTPYKNWTIRQIVHHIADSHLHSYIRFKWALTENNPTIKAYEEADWVRLDDCEQGDVAPALLLIDGLHSKWVQTLQSMTPDRFARTFVHPQSGETVSLWTALNYYPWHARHHTGQIQWLRDAHHWPGSVPISEKL